MNHGNSKEIPCLLLALVREEFEKRPQSTSETPVAIRVLIWLGS